MKSLMGGRLFVIFVAASLLLCWGAVDARADEPYTFGLSLSTLNNPFFVSVKEGAEAEAKLLNVNLVVTDAQNRLDKQVGDVEDLIQKKVDALLINPTDSAGIAAVVKKANKAGIPVFAIDRGIDTGSGAKVVAQIASDNVFGGRLQARFLAYALNGKGAVVELEGIPGASAAIDRKAGFEEELAKVAPGIKIIASQEAGFDQAKGLEVMQNLLQANPGKIDAVVAANDSMALGALKAIQQTNAAGSNGRRILVIGFDAIDPALEQIKKGAMDATIAQQPALMGQLGVGVARLLSISPLLFTKLSNGQFFPVPVTTITTDSLK
ncbi:MAG: D-ribose ABC transporter substrate-binding protein [Desulfobacterales bacterium]|nr:D-ribose ABC transporter substrate-binding protein [Desulfobacterales bacterium]